MRTFIDPDTCIGCALCADTCPDIYEMDGDIARVIADPVPDGREECSLEAEEGCPVDAISHS